MSTMVTTTCTDCARRIVMDVQDLEARKRLARLCECCATNRITSATPTDDSLPQVLGNYCIKVELQWAISREDLRYRAIGDVEDDFARRSLARVKEALQLVAGCGHSVTPIGHYHVFEDELRRCIGPAAAEGHPPGFVRKYHGALNRLAVLCMELQKSIRDLTDSQAAEIDFTEVATALAVGRRMGWGVSKELEELVKESESGEMPMGEEEARRRLGL